MSTYTAEVRCLLTVTMRQEDQHPATVAPLIKKAVLSAFGKAWENDQGWPLLGDAEISAPGSVTRIDLSDGRGRRVARIEFDADKPPQDPHA